MLNYYLDGDYIDRVLIRTDRVKSDKYYVQMAQAWLLATALKVSRSQRLSITRDNNLAARCLTKPFRRRLRAAE